VELVEAQRKRAGTHIDAVSYPALWPEYEEGCLAVTPLSGTRETDRARQLAACLTRQGIRVLLSGVGGDEVLGGVPTPLPELADLFSRAQVIPLVRQLMNWALAQRHTVWHLLAQTIQGFLPARVERAFELQKPIPWLESSFAKKHRFALGGYRKRWSVLGPPPSFQENLQTLNALRRQLACAPVCSQPLHEKRYPYLDRDLLEFLYAIPREQLVRPGQRRSLMRRALAGTVPSQILSRRRKAFVVRRPMVAISEQREQLSAMTQHMLSESFGFVSSERFIAAIEKARHGHEIHVVAMLRTLSLESWLNQLRTRGLLVEGSRLSPATSAQGKFRIEVPL